MLERLLDKFHMRLKRFMAGLCLKTRWCGELMRKGWDRMSSRRLES